MSTSPSSNSVTVREDSEKAKIPTSKSAIGDIDENIEETHSAVDPADEINLISMEKFDDRASPELFWPDAFDTTGELMREFETAGKRQPLYSTEFTPEETAKLQKLSQLPTGNVILKVKELHDIAYQLGLEESKEMTRAKYLNIFRKKINKDQ